MHGFFNTMFFAFFALFPILNPPAMAPIFLEMTSAVSDSQRHRLAGLIGKYTFLMLLTVLLVGGWLLKLFGISIPVIRIAGGLLLFNTAWRMLNDTPKLSVSEQSELKAQMTSHAFFPLTLPVTAGPGSIAVTLTLVPTGSLLAVKTWATAAAAAGGIGLAAVSVFIFYRYADRFIRRLGKTGAQTISKVSAFILLAIGVQIIWDGIRGLILSI
ncbi:MAG: MarC family protein [Elusimicrobiaceae bacterium]|nr:MarC family protein [Elusimicrobiaceae bacterium]